MPQEPTPAAAPPGPLFMEIVQFVALMSVMASVLSFSLYGFGTVTFTPYYFVLDGNGSYSTVSESFALTLPKGSQSLELAVGLIVAYSFLVLIAGGLWLFAVLRPRYRVHLPDMAFALSALTFLGLAFLALSRFPSTLKLQTQVLAWLFKIVVLWFGLRGRILSWSTIAFFGLMLALVAGLTPDARLHAALRTLPALLIFLATVLLVRLVWLAISQNAFFVSKLGTRGTLRYLARTATLWLPMVILAAPYFIAEHAAKAALNTRLRDTLPAGIVVTQPGADSLSKLDADLPRESRPIVEMTTAWELFVRFSEFANLMRQAQQELIDQVKNGQVTLKDGVMTQQAKASDAVTKTTNTSLGRLASYESFSMAEASRKAFTSSFAKPLTLPVSHSDTPVVGPAIDIGVEIADQNIQSAYRKTTAEMGDYVANQGAQMDRQKTILTGVLTGVITDASSSSMAGINSTAATANGAIDTGAGILEKNINASFDFAIRNVSCQLFNRSPDQAACPPHSLDLNKSAQLNIWYAFAFLEGFLFLSNVLFGLVCVKSFVYVFSRVAFNRQAGGFLTLGQLEGTPVLPDSRITRFPSRFVLNPPEAAVYYVSRKFQGRGRPPQFAIPQPLHAPIARLLHGAMSMNKVSFKPGDGPVSYTARFGSEFVLWDLQPGEEIVFSFHHFVAMSETVRISTLISARLSALVLGHIIFSTATGPGQIIFLTEGRAEFTNRDETGDSLPPDRIVAMHRDARLNVESELGVVDVYISDAYVQPTAHGQVVVDVDKHDGGGVGLIRFIRHFLWPG